LSALLGRLAAACSSDLVLSRPLAAQHGPIETEAVSAVITRIDRPAEVSVAARAGGVSREVALPASMALPPHAQELVATLSTAAELGMSAVEIGDYGALPDAAMVGIRQAIRIARRKTKD